MPKINVVDMAGKVVSELELNENVFGIEPNKTAMHSVVVNYLANQRQGTAAAESPGDRRVPVMQDRVPQDLLSGDTVVSPSARSPVPTDSL